MKYDKDQKKMTYEMKSPGDAWMDHVEKHHNASAVTPAYLAPKEKAKSNKIEDKIAEFKKSQEQGKSETISFTVEKEKDSKQKTQDIERER